MRALLTSICNGSVFALLQTAFHSDRKPGYPSLIQLTTRKKPVHDCAHAVPWASGLSLEKIILRQLLFSVS